jgi:hypothetical protein
MPTTDARGVETSRWKQPTEPAGAALATCPHQRGVPAMLWPLGHVASQVSPVLTAVFDLGRNASAAGRCIRLTTSSSFGEQIVTVIRVATTPKTWTEKHRT